LLLKIRITQDSEQNSASGGINSVLNIYQNKNHIGALVTINDRMAGYVKIERVPNKESKTVTNATINALLSLSYLLYTILQIMGKSLQVTGK
jgi:hypothetical protein